MDLLNVKLALRSKIYKINFSEISDMFFKTKTDVYYVLMQRAARGDLDPLFTVLEKTRLRQILRPHRENILKNKDLGSFEHDLELQLLRKALLLSRRGMLSVDSIIGFMFAKEIEIKNIKAITKARFLGIEDAAVRKSIALA
jgi:vacuolar-type H+-ATPase subunit C/Vma6